MGVMHDLEKRKTQFVNRITKSYVGLITMQIYCTICVQFNQVKWHSLEGLEFKGMFDLLRILDTNIYYNIRMARFTYIV